LGERLLCKQEVIGSIPFTSTTRYHGLRCATGNARAPVRHPSKPCGLIGDPYDRDPGLIGDL
jgi:hypothetical protein